MTPEEFVATMKQLAVTDVALDTVEVLRQPPGRSTWPIDRERSEWFNALNEHDQGMVAGIVERSAFGAAFSLFAVFDGVSAFDDARGSLRLTYLDREGNETVLNDPERCELHAELRGDGPPP